MESLPLELLQRILELACTDGGHTGNALCATSKHIRAAARRVRFHTLHIAAYGSRFEDFVAFFKREWKQESDTGLRVRHLYLRLSSSKWTASVALALHSGPVLRSSEDAIRELIGLVAPDLWSLVVHNGPWGLRWDYKFPILDHMFPLVREASFIGIPGPGRLMAPDAKLSTVFPSATHLHLTPDLNSDIHLNSWATLAPHVTHLRISAVQRKQHVLDLAEAVGVHVVVSIWVVPSGSPEPPAPRTYPSVRFLLLEPMALPKGGRCGNPAMAHGAMLQGLRDVVRKCRRRDGGVRAVLLAEPDNVPFPQRDEALLREWVERVEGGVGWWKGLQ